MNTERNGEAKPKPVNCGCGGEAKVEEWVGRWYVRCKNANCLISTKNCDTEAEAITAWNRAMSGSAEKSSKVERSAQVIKHDFCATVEGLKLHEAEYLCGACKKKVIGGDEYCSHCGAKLDWDEDIPMEYFESGGI